MPPTSRFAVTVSALTGGNPETSRGSFYTFSSTMSHPHKLAAPQALHSISFAAALAMLCACPALAQAATTLPPRTQWRASSSSAETPAMAPAFAIDGDATTKWGGAFAAHHWLQVDLGDVAQVAGVLLHWDSGFAASYRIVVSANGQDWEDVFETTDGQGGVDYVFFPATSARYLRLASLPLSADPSRPRGGSPGCTSIRQA